MLLNVEQAAKRYDVSTSTIRNKHSIIESKDGFDVRSTGGSTRNIYKSSVLDKLAREGVFGHKGVLAMKKKRRRRNAAKT